MSSIYVKSISPCAKWRTTFRFLGRTVAPRDVLVHVIEEYARHAGHADLLRECLDGRTGQ